MSIDKLDEMSIRNVMKPPVTNIKESNIEVVYHQLFATPSEMVEIVDDDDKLVGIVTKTAMMKGLLKHDKNEIIEEVMYTNFTSINDDSTVHDAIQLMNEKKVNKLPVINDQGEIVGTISRTNVLNKMKSFLSLRL